MSDQTPHSEQIDLYDIRPHPPVVSQVCRRCGAEVGVRRIHDEWHDKAAAASVICGLSGNYGAFMEPLACAYPHGHGGPHAWASLPTFVHGKPTGNANYDHARCGTSGGCAAPVADFDPVNCPAEIAPSVVRDDDQDDIHQMLDEQTTAAYRTCYDGPTYLSGVGLRCEEALGHDGPHVAHLGDRDFTWPPATSAPSGEPS